MDLDPVFSPTQRRHRSLYQDWDEFDTAWLACFGLASFFLYLLGQRHPDSLSPSAIIPRLPCTILAASAVPLLYGLGRELFLQRTAALLASSIYLTQWGVLQEQCQWMPHLLLGLRLSLSLTVLYCVLRSRRNLRWTLGIGLGLGLQVYFDPQGIPALVAIAIGFITWDTPRILSAKHFWWGIGLGFMAVALGLAIRQELMGVAFWTAQPLWDWTQTPEIFQGSVRMPQWDNLGLQVWNAATLLIAQSLPWIYFWPVSWAFWMGHANLSWGRLCLVWGGVALTLVGTGTFSQIYLVLALVCGAYLARFWQPEAFWGLPGQPLTPLPASLRWGMGSFAVAVWLRVIYEWSQATDYPGLGLGLVVAIATTGTSILAIRNHPLWLPTLIWGSYACLLLIGQQRGVV